jgi:hypothetical protein
MGKRAHSTHAPGEKPQILEHRQSYQNATERGSEPHWRFEILAVRLESRMCDCAGLTLYDPRRCLKGIWWSGGAEHTLFSDFQWHREPMPVDESKW